jgi:hypothetical protein
MRKGLWIQDGFAPEAKALRESFEQNYRDPRQAGPDRFVWDYWHVPDQYTLLRTPASQYFPAKAFRAFLRRLSLWGQRTLGCAGLTPPWLSLYLEGCEQKLHSDVPHGPWAYVFSLSPAKPVYQGGETLLLRPEVLQYWQNFSDAADREYNSFVKRIPARFNRLVVFDPRVPHGVTPLRGTQDPREGRLVVHGWFTEPRPYLAGALRAKQVAPLLDDAVNGFVEDLAGLGSWHGVMSVRISVPASGRALAPKILADSLVPLDAASAPTAELHRRLRRALGSLRFPRAKGRTEITLPLLFR